MGPYLHLHVQSDVIQRAITDMQRCAQDFAFRELILMLCLSYSNCT